MPYKITKQGDKYCVAKKDTGKAIDGGCHKTRAEAVDHLQAIMASDTMYSIAESFKEIDLVEATTPELDLGEDYEEYTIGEGETPWEGPIAFEDQCTGDNRCFSADSVSWHDLPLPFSFQKQSTEGHSGSVVIGRIDDIEKKDGVVFARGVILDTPEGNEYKRLMEADAAGSVSIDGDSAVYAVEDLENGKHKVNFSAIRVRGLTAVSIGAFADARIHLINASTELGAESMEEFKSKKRKRKKGMTYHWTAESITAGAAAPVFPSASFFRNPVLAGPTAHTITEDGRVFGHLALWGTCHIGMPACTKPPKGKDYSYFHVGSLRTAEGEEISVGSLTFNTGHASVHDTAYAAAAHYDHTGAVGADVVVGEDQFGIWYSGALRPDLTDEQVRSFRAAPLSGDWRRIGARLELVGALSVNTPGFPVPRQRTKVLVASGQDQTFISTTMPEDFDEIARADKKFELALKVAEVEFLSFLDTLSPEELDELETLSAEMEEFYNTCHDTDSGLFCEGPDGPGRVRDNMKKAERVLGKKAPTWMKNLLSRKRGAAQVKAAKGLGKNTPKYMRDMLKRKIDEAVDTGRA